MGICVSRVRNCRAVVAVARRLRAAVEADDDRSRADRSAGRLCTGRTLRRLQHAADEASHRLPVHQVQLESRPLEWRSTGTGLCSYRVRGVV